MSQQCDFDKTNNTALSGAITCAFLTSGNIIPSLFSGILPVWTGILMSNNVLANNCENLYDFWIFYHKRSNTECHTLVFEMPDFFCTAKHRHRQYSMSLKVICKVQTLIDIYYTVFRKNLSSKLKWSVISVYHFCQFWFTLHFLYSL